MEALLLSVENIQRKLLEDVGKEQGAVLFHPRSGKMQDGSAKFVFEDFSLVCRLSVSPAHRLAAHCLCGEWGGKRERRRRRKKVTDGLMLGERGSRRKEKMKRLGRGAPHTPSETDLKQQRLCSSPLLICWPQSKTRVRG